MTKAKFLSSAVISGIFAMGCCVSPIFLALLGIISAGAAVDLAYNLYGNYAWYFRTLGLVILGIAFLFYLRSKNQCSIKGVYKNRSILLGSIVILVLTYIILYFFTTYLGIVATND